MGKKVKKDEKPPPDDVFDALLVESRQAATVVLMLSSPEEDVQSKACEAIYKFVDKCEENKKVLLDLQAADPLLKLMQGEDATVRRHAVMALGVMCQHPEVRRYLRKKEESIPTFVNLLQPEICDTVVYEFAALGISYLATEFSAKVTIMDHGGMEHLVRLLSSGDPDVQKNSIEAIAQMALDYQARGSVREYDGFPPILELLNSEYAIIQKLALLALERLLQDVENRSVVRELEGVAKLVDFLAKPEWNDLHVMVVMVLSNLLEDAETLTQMKETGGLKKLVALITDQPPPEDEAKKGDKKAGSRAGKKSAGKDGKGKKGAEEDEKETVPGGDSIIPTLPDVKMCAAKAIARCARSANNRRLLHEMEAEKMLIALLSHESALVQAAAAQAIGIMSESESSRDSVREWEGIPPMVKLLNTDSSDVKEAVTLAIANLTAANIPNCQEIVNLNGLDPLIACLADTREEVVANVAVTLTNMAQDEALRAEAQNKGVITALIEPLRTSNTNVQSKAVLAISAFACDADSRIELRDHGGLEPIVMLLNSGSDEVRRNASWAITVAAVDESIAMEISKLGGLETLQQIQLSSTRKSPFIDAALQRLLDSNLSAKYALTGHLSSLNITDDGFYDPGQLRQGSKFLDLEDYLRQELNDKRPIFYINGKQDRPATQQDKMEDSDSKSELVSKPSNTRQSKTMTKDPNRKSKITSKEKELEKQREEELAAQAQREAEAMAEQERAKTPEPPTDRYFVKYIEDAMEKIMPLPTIKEQIQALAQFVSDKMGGPIEKGQLPYFGWELPLSQVRFEGRTNVVPIGKIKMGIHTHRALLFKALADRLSIGCTLTRGQYNRAWNEVMVADEEEGDGSVVFPPKPYIVDLIHEPGKLLPLDSREAVAYQKI